MGEYEDNRAVDPRDLAVAERRGRAVRMRNSGMSYAKIGDALGVSEDTARRDVRKAVAEHLSVPVEDMIGQQRAILMDLRQRLYVNVLQGDTKSMETMLKTLEHEAKLFGLYAPTRVAVAHGTEDFAATAAKLMTEIGMAVPPEFVAPEPDVAAIEGPPIIDADVEPEIADAGPEKRRGGTDEWVR